MNNGNMLPIGTVVNLKNGTKRVMIIGFYPVDKNSNTMYNYSGCLYPEGFISNNKLVLFNHNQIEKIYHMGLSDQEEMEFKNQLNTLLNNSTNVNIK